MTEVPFRQRKLIRELVAKHGMDQKKVCAAYARAEKAGTVIRSRDVKDETPEQYAQTLWKDALRWGWLTKTEGFR